MRMTEASTMPRFAERAAAATPAGIASRMRGLSDRAIAWLFITPTMALLLAINIFPLIWTIRLSFTNFRANRPNEPVDWVGLPTFGIVALGSGVGENSTVASDFPGVANKSATTKGLLSALPDRQAAIASNTPKASIA